MHQDMTVISPSRSHCTESHRYLPSYPLAVEIIVTT